MTIISPDEYNLLMSISGYELNLQATNIGKKYGLSANQIIAMLPNQPSSQQQTNPGTGNSNNRLTQIFLHNLAIGLSTTQAQTHHKGANK